MLKHCLLFSTLLFFTLVKSKCCTNPLIRETVYGLIEGIEETSAVDPLVKYYAFRGIPYAKPPIGAFRFKEPQAPEEWNDILSTKRDANACVQIHFFPTPNNDAFGSEDCLYLNVYVPKHEVEQNQPLPIMLWLHGGGFLSGSGSEYSPSYFMTEPIILITCQFRVGVLGFLSAQDENIMGNMGLKDVIYVLRWIKENVKNFNGNPEKVTVFGESSGAAMVDLLTLSPLSKGLIHHAIVQSGSSLNTWALLEKPKQAFWALMKTLNYVDTNVTVLTQMLQDISVKDLIVAANKTFGFLDVLYGYTGWHPVVEVDHKSAFLTKHPYDILKSGNFNHVPYLSGYNTKEGFFFWNAIQQGILSEKKYSHYLLPSNLIASKNNSLDEQEAASQISSRYFNDDYTDHEKGINFSSYLLFIHGIRESLKFHSLHGPAYLYQFSFPGGIFSAYPGETCHCQELQFLFVCDLFALGGGNITNPNPTNIEILTRNRMVRLWANFARYGNPTPNPNSLLQNIIWPQVAANETIRVLEIGTQLNIIDDPDEEEVRFWEHIFGTNLK